MSSNSPMDMDTELPNAHSGDDRGGAYSEETPWDVASPEAESSEVSRARAQAAALAKAASAAKARYARLSAPAKVRNRNSNYDSMSDPMTASRIGRLETALAGTSVVTTIGNELQKSFPTFAEHPVAKVGLPWLPLVFLKPAKRASKIGSFVTDPRVVSAVLASGGLAIVSQIANRKPSSEMAGLRIMRIERYVEPGSEDKIYVEAVDHKGRVITATMDGFSDQRTVKVN
jgi:hypothetical protein